MQDSHQQGYHRKLEHTKTRRRPQRIFRHGVQRLARAMAGMPAWILSCGPRVACTGHQPQQAAMLQRFTGASIFRSYFSQDTKCSSTFAMLCETSLEAVQRTQCCSPLITCQEPAGPNKQCGARVVDDMHVQVLRRLVEDLRPAKNSHVQEVYKRFRGFCRGLCGIITWGVAVGADAAALAKACRVKKVMEERFTHA